MINRPALGNFPQHDWADILRTGVLKVAPKGLDQVFTAMAGSDANEVAYKAAFMWKRRHERGGPDVEFNEAEISSAMNNQAPGSPHMSILSFRSGFHGRLFGSLSTTRSKPIHKLDIPAFDWPQASFPHLKYPLAEHESENAKEEARCLAETEDLIQNFHNPVAAVVVEPIQSEGGDNHASPAFFKGLRELTRRHNVLLIVDEVQTGVGATGKFWAHEHWNSADPPDMVTFSKKAQTAGYYYGNMDLRPNKPYRQFNTWMGDPAKTILFRAIINEIERLNLVENTAHTGEYLYSGLERLAQQYPGQIQNLRGQGQGTFIAWDSPRRDDFLKRAKGVGVNVGGSGEKAVRLRPMLIFQKHHGECPLLDTGCMAIDADKGRSGYLLGSDREADIVVRDMVLDISNGNIGNWNVVVISELYSSSERATGYCKYSKMNHFFTDYTCLSVSQHPSLHHSIPKHLPTPNPTPQPRT